MSQESDIFKLSAQFKAAFRTVEDLTPGLRPAAAQTGSVVAPAQAPDPGRPGEIGGARAPSGAGPAADASSSQNPTSWDVEAPPPAGNTGGRITNPLQIKLDWLSVTLPTARLAAARALVSGFLGEAADEDFGKHTYEKSARWPSGALLLWTESKPRPECLLSLNGDSVDFIPRERQREFVRALEDLGAKCSRADVALDDYSRQLIDLDLVAAAADAGDFCQFRLANVHRPKQRVSGTMALLGYGVDFGRRGKDGSGVFVQFYDKALESRGEINANRLEVRFAKERAALFFECFASSLSDDSFVRKLCQAIGGAIDFRSRASGDPNLARCPRLAWWAALLDILGQARHVVTRGKPPLQRTVEWFKQSVAGSLSVVRSMFDSLGGDFLHFVSAALDKAEPRAWKHLGKRALGLDLHACYG